MKHADRKPLVLAALALMAPVCLAQPARIGTGLVLPDRARVTELEAPKTPLFGDLGTQQYAISTTSPSAQRFFDQGLRLVWLSEPHAAWRSFTEAERLDPRCAMCAWGVAWTLTTLDTAEDSAATRTVAREALDRARSRARGVSPRESGLISALAMRFSDSVNRAEALITYSSSLARLSEQFPDDDHIRLMHAHSLLALTAQRSVLTRDGRRGMAELAQREVEVVRQRSPSHSGACVLLARIVIDTEPARALPCITQLATGLPRALHLAQLRSLLEIRIGRYADAMATSEQALSRWRRGEAGFAGVTDATTEIRVVDVSCSLHQTLTFAASMSGQRELSMQSAREAAKHAAVAAPRSQCEPALPLPAVTLPALTLVTFGDWNAVLREPIPSSATPHARAVVLYARGVAFAAKQRWHDAELALGAVQALSGRARGAHERLSMQLAWHALSGELALRRGRPALAAESFREAADLEDELAMHYAIAWYYPTRHSLALALLAAGRARESADVYEADLRRHPENGWSLLGLAHALGALGKRDDARRAHERFAVAFSAADVTVPGSRF